MEKPIIFGFLYLEESILSILEENTCADEFFLPNNIFVSLPIDVAITKRFDSCYLTISKSHFSVQQILNIYLILNHSSKKKKSIHLLSCFKLNFLPNLKSNSNKDFRKRQFYWPLKDEINEHRDRFFSRNWI